MKANSDKSKQSNKATRRVLAGVLCGASVLSLVLSLVMPPISQAIANDAQTEETVTGDFSTESTDVDNTNNGDTENQISDDGEGGETGDGTAEMTPLSDDAEAEGAAQPADDSNSDENAIPLASVNAKGYTEIQGDVTGKFNNGGNYCLTGDAWSSAPITISRDTTIDLACYKLYYNSGNSDANGQDCSFITVSRDATLTVEGAAEDKPVEAVSNEPGQTAEMQWIENTPQSLTYFVTESTPSGLGTSEKTYLHTVTNFGAIVACKEGYVNQVISVADGGTLNLKGGMITTPRALGYNGHVIFSRGTVNISGGYVTNGNGGGWGGGLCMAAGSLDMTGGVIAANKAASGGGIFADSGVTLDLSGGVISGNATYANGINNGLNTDSGGYGGGVYTKGATVTISGSACITNNQVNDRITDDNLYNNGLLGGGGIACTHDGKLTMMGGSVTANYSHEAGGGIYAGFWNQAITFKMTGGTIAGNVAENAEGGGLRISTSTHATIDADGKIYITNNKTMTGSNSGEGRKGDWGGGGIFIQKNGRLNILKSLITDNKAGGWSGGIGACPTGETIVSHSKGAAIYDNTDNVDQDGNKLTAVDQDGNTVPAYHYSAGGDNKNEDSDEKNYVTSDFQKSGHKDFFLVRNKNGADKTIAVVLGKMLGGGSAGWQGTCDGETITIDANGGAEAKWMFGLAANPSDQAKRDAQTAATTIISGNYSYTHGGGIMTNGDLVVGEVSDLNVYPSMKLNATKVLKDEEGNSQEGLGAHNYRFMLLRQDGTIEPSWKADGTFDKGGCIVAGEASADPETGKITFDSGKEYSSGQYVFYLVEEKPTSDKDESNTKFDKTIYKIKADISLCKTDTLMNFNISHYKVSSVTVYKKDVKDKGFVELDSGSYSVDISQDSSQDSTTATVTIGSKEKPTFTNKIVPPASWTPMATKVVEGGEMKAFTLQLAKDSEFETIIGTAVTSGDNTKQTLSFSDDSGKLIELKYSLSDIRDNPDDSGDSTGGLSKTFKYYVREENESSAYPHYKFDQSVYEIKVVATDNAEGEINCKVTYKQIQDRDGKPVTNDTEHTFSETDTPTFTNTYSTSLPLSGMSGVTLTYLAGAAVLCAAAAWMHIRRKANAKGGERRE